MKEIKNGEENMKLVAYSSRDRIIVGALEDEDKLLADWFVSTGEDTERYERTVTEGCFFMDARITCCGHKYDE